MQLWIGNLPYGATPEEVRETFANEGVDLAELRLIVDRETGESKGYAFAELKNPDEAADVINRMNRTVRIGGRVVVVSPANERKAGGGRPR